MANSFTDKLKKQLPAAGDSNWEDEYYINERIDDVVMGALLTSNRVISGLEVTAGTGLNVDYPAGVAAVSGVSYNIGAGSLVLDGASTTPEKANWIYINDSGVVVSSTTQPSGAYVPLALVGTDNTTILRIADLRPFRGALDSHLPDETNPHNVDAADVGLESVANQGKSDSYSLNSTAYYATAKAVYDGIRAANMHDHTNFLEQAEVDARVRALMVNLKSTNGYQKFPDGLILQYGVHGYGSSKTVYYPVVFPAAVRAISFMPQMTDGAINFKSVSVGSFTTAYFNSMIWAHDGVVTDATFFWMAMGY